MSGTSCGRCESPLEAEDLRCAICSLPTPGDMPVPDRARASVLRCEQCGAAISYSVEARAPKCVFCGAVMHLEEPEDPIEQADAYLPFRVGPDAAGPALTRWLGSLGWFRPSDLQSTASLDHLRPLYWVGWVFDAETLVSWTADSNAGAQRSAWAPHAGQSPLTMRSVLVSASRGLTAEECARLAPSFDLATAQAAPHGPGDAVVERFDVQRSSARRTITRAVETEAARHATSWIPGSTYRNLRLSVLLRRLGTRRLAFPTWVLAYRYKAKVYRALVHGQDAQNVSGAAPYSAAKIALAILGGLALIVAIIFLVGSR